MGKSVAIMQPYFFPYLGYYQLLREVDQFIIYDDVDFINRGWINRNNILVNRKPFLFTIPLKKASQNKHIRDTEVVQEDKWKRKLLKTNTMAYQKSPFFQKAIDLIEDVLFSPHESIAELSTASIKKVRDYLNLEVELTESSVPFSNSELKAGDRLIDICRQCGADRYVNPSGGMTLYTKEQFAAGGLTLDFLKSDPVPYHQTGEEFTPYLSMIDVLMNVSPEEISDQLLPAYSLI